MKNLSPGEKLAIDRTKLANERTFLAYFRTSVVFIGGGLTIIKINLFENIDYLGEILIVMGPLLLIFGIYERRKISRRINSYYKDNK